MPRPIRRTSLLIALIPALCEAEAQDPVPGYVVPRTWVRERSIASLSETRPAEQRIPRRPMDSEGAMQGTVRGSDGTVVPSASVRLKHLATGRIREAATDSEGTFRLAALPPGDYQLVVERAGYETETRERISIQPGAVTTLLVSMSSGPSPLPSEVGERDAARIVRKSRSTQPPRPPEVES